MSHAIFNQTITVLNPGLIRSPYSTELVESWDEPEVTLVDFPVSIQSMACLLKKARIRFRRPECSPCAARRAGFR